MQRKIPTCLLALLTSLAVAAPAARAYDKDKGKGKDKHEEKDKDRAKNKDKGDHDDDRDDDKGGMRFRGMDRNRDGVITRNEWRGNDQSFRVHDCNRDGVLSGDEVRSGHTCAENGSAARNESLIRERTARFRQLDVNHDGVIRPAEWAGRGGADFNALDRNHDGILSFDEFVYRR